MTTIDAEPALAPVTLHLLAAPVSDMVKAQWRGRSGIAYHVADGRIHLCIFHADGRALISMLCEDDLHLLCSAIAADLEGVPLAGAHVQ